MNILIVRLGALGDIVHAIPAAAALRRAYPMARIDWAVDVRYRQIVELVRVLDRVLTVEATIGGWIHAVRSLRAAPYDAALDFQGLMKSAVLARASGASRVVGFSIWHLREKGARPFYSEVESAATPGSDRSGAQTHVIHQNLALLRSIGVESTSVEFPLRATSSIVVDDVQRELGGAPFALLNPGAAWPNKRWPADRFGAVAMFLREIRGVRSLVLWGPGEAPLAHAVVEASGGAALLAPPTPIADLVELSRAATVMISGDTGPLHIAAAVGTPIVAVFGPTDPLRNGPFAADDIAVSRYGACACHYARRCRSDRWCLAEVTVAEVTAAIQQRLSSVGRP
jgi:lipopolysaccharide heptosyltransferase I